MGDCNLDYLKLSDAGQLQPLIDLMLERIYPHGVQQSVKVLHAAGQASRTVAWTISTPILQINSARQKLRQEGPLITS